MGKLVYGSTGRSFDVDDRLLAHLRIVFMNKLRRAEPFMFHHPDGSGSSSIWVHPAVPMVFHFYGSRAPSINRAWVEALIQEASSSNGLFTVQEPVGEFVPA